MGEYAVVYVAMGEYAFAIVGQWSCPIRRMNAIYREEEYVRKRNTNTPSIPFRRSLLAAMPI